MTVGTRHGKIPGDYAEYVERCPQMTYRFRRYAAAEFIAWLHLHEAKYATQHQSLSIAKSNGAASLDGSIEWARVAMTVIADLMSRVHDKFPVRDWHAASTLADEYLAGRGLAREPIPDQCSPATEIGPDECAPTISNRGPDSSARRKSRRKGRK